VGHLLAIGASIAVWLVAFIFATISYCLTVGIAWLYYRPAKGVIFLAVVAIGVLALVLG